MDVILLSDQKLADLNAELLQLKASLKKDEEEVTKMGGPMDSFKEAAAFQVTLGAKRKKVKDLTNILSQAQTLPEYISGAEVCLGKWFTIDNGITKSRYRLVHPVEADPTKCLVSQDSPLGIAVFGKQTGGNFSLNNREFKLISVE